MQVSDRLLFCIESDRARTTEIKGQIGGSIKEAVHLLREANRAMGQRVSISGDAYYWMERARKLKEELAKVRTEQEPLRRKNLKLEKEIGKLEARLDEFAEKLEPSAILRRRCASPVSPVREETDDIKVDVVETGQRLRRQRRSSEEEGLQPSGNLLIASNLMGINEAVRGILCRLEVLKSRSRRDPFLAPRPTVPPVSSLDGPTAKGVGKTRGRKGNKTIPADSAKKKRARKKKAEHPVIAVEAPVSSKDRPVFTGDIAQDTEPASSQVNLCLGLR
jgi:hypothetical protein